MINKIMGDSHSNKIIGMTVEEARNHLAKKDKTLRITSEDGKSYMVSYDHDKNRINVIVEKGIVVNIDRVG